MKPTLIIDMDGVTCQFVEKVCREHNDITGNNLTVSDITDWNMGLFGVKREHWQKAGFFADLKPVPGAIETLCNLSRRYRLTIATDTMGIDFVQSDKQRWIDTHIPFVDDVYFLSDKSAVPGELLFDDAEHHLITFPAITVKMATPYNSHVNADYTVGNWHEFEVIVNAIKF